MTPKVSTTIPFLLITASGRGNPCGKVSAALCDMEYVSLECVCGSTTCTCREYRVHVHVHVCTCRCACMVYSYMYNVHICMAMELHSVFISAGIRGRDPK